MTNQKKKPTPVEPDSENYFGAGIAFFVIGISLLVSEPTRAAGLPFFVLGLVFIAQGQKKP